jgi:hypothetical protein
MDIINRRKALAVVAAVPAAAAITAIPVLGLRAESNAETRIKHHTAELERAMLEKYGRKVEVLRFEPSGGIAAVIMLAANGKGTARPAKNSRWLYIGQDS